MDSRPGQLNKLLTQRPATFGPGFACASLADKKKSQKRGSMSRHSSIRAQPKAEEEAALLQGKAPYGHTRVGAGATCLPRASLEDVDVLIGAIRSARGQGRASDVLRELAVGLVQTLAERNADMELQVRRASAGEIARGTVSDQSGILPPPINHGVQRRELGRRQQAASRVRIVNLGCRYGGSFFGGDEAVVATMIRRHRTQKRPTLGIKHVPYPLGV